MDVFLVIALLILFSLQVLTYLSVAFLYSWLKLRVIQPSQVSVSHAEEEQDTSDDNEASRGLYL